MLPDRSINPGEMTSFNHYALGAVADWMHRTIEGLGPLEPGYRSILIAPHIGADLRLDVTVPDGASATVRLPGEQDRTLPGGPAPTDRPGSELRPGPGIGPKGHPAQIRAPERRPLMTATTVDHYHVLVDRLDLPAKVRLLTGGDVFTARRRSRRSGSVRSRCPTGRPGSAG